MLLELESGANAAAAREWLIGVVRYIGPGFHVDTPFGDYVNKAGPTFTQQEADKLDRSMARAFDVLGDVEPYDLTLPEVQKQLGMVCESQVP